MFISFIYSGLSFIDNLVFVLNAVGAGFSFYYNHKAYTNTSIDLPLRRAFFIIAGLSVIYFMAYIVLLVFQVDLGTWGSVMRGVSLLVWPFVWVYPAFIMDKRSRNVEVQVAERLAEEIKTQAKAKEE